MGPDPLAEFYAATPRQPAGLSGRAGLEGQVDAIVESLGLPAELVDGGNLRLGSDVGDFLLIVDDETSELVALQSLQSVESVEGAAQEMYGLLRLNYEARGVASFGALKDQGEDFLVLTARVSADAVSRASVEEMLADCFALSRRVQELLGEAPAGATEPPQPEPVGAPPPQEPPVDAPAAETVFAQPVPTGPPPAAEPAAPEPAGVTVFEPTPAAAGEPPAPAEPAAPEPAPAADQPGGGLDFPPPQVDDPALAFPPPGQGAPAEPAAAEQPPAVQQPPAAQPAPSYPPPAQPTPAPQQMAPPNWYPDPYSQARLRYWDGQNWTEHVAQ